MTSPKAKAKPALITWKQRRFLEKLWAELGKTGPLPTTKQGAYHATLHAIRLLEARPESLIARARAERPSKEQVHDLAVLARRAGEPMPIPRDYGEAVRELTRLKEGRPKEP